MIVFYGLGNNDQKYFLTKHNSGRLVLENLALLNGLKFQEKADYFYIKNGDFYFLISKGFMNSSGQPLASFFSYFKIDCSQPNFALIILQDDSDQIVGKQKFVQAGGPAGHKGVIDIYKQSLSFGLDINSIYRLKIGIRPENNKQKSETFVLSSINNFEKEWYKKISQKIQQNKDNFNPVNLAILQNEFNTEIA
jgi:PTH1 family peptidyl-tRNA hydrolase